ncbi:MAG TPA: tRNA (adenosine(37)-N6)-threonylcarbamoyltransferase complex ATPase subunit type 1 TsaE [Thermoanaerobaculia bacterium]|nr:tRNA (adenosine(37)-N6)-threonylcarbamoyltransferase complex ATPase subunit type 1 TsaE [Thermoanaerobaculia bacterium]
MERFRSESEQETQAIGRQLASRLPPHAVVQLTGDLGAGKTLLVKAIAAALGADPDQVSSPSFAIVHEYPLPDRPPLIHIDGYRLTGHRREWDEIGIPDLLREPGLKFIEWPNVELARIGGRLLDVRILINEDDSRTIEVSGLD